MRTAALLAAAAVLIGSGVAIAMKWSAFPSETARLHATVVAAGQPASPAVSTMKIVPAPAIDPHAEVFLGTGDGSGGGWIRP